MKKLYAILFIVALVHTEVYGQAKKPTIMVVPANVWCLSLIHISEPTRPY